MTFYTEQRGQESKRTKESKQQKKKKEKLGVLYAAKLVCILSRQAAKNGPHNTARQEHEAISATHRS